MSQSSLPLSANSNASMTTQPSFMLSFLPALQANAPWLLRYLVAAVVLSKTAVFKGNSYLGPLARISSKEQMGTAILLAIKQESSSSFSSSSSSTPLQQSTTTTTTITDPIIQFVKALFIDLDFPLASEMLSKSVNVCENDFFLFQFKAEWKERSRYLYSEAYCKVHNQINIQQLSGQLGLSADEGEKWIVNLIREARLDAKIDLKENMVHMNRYDVTAHQTVIDKTKSILERSARIDYAPDSSIQQGGSSTNRAGRAGRGRGNQPSGTRQQTKELMMTNGDMNTPAPAVEVQ